MPILSGEKNAVVRRRAEKLNIEVIHGAANKEEILDTWLRRNNFSWHRLSFPGSVWRCRRKCCCLKWQTSYGGEGALRELLDLITRQQTK